MPRIACKRLTALIEDAGYQPRPYSGRGMYGHSCVSFTIEDETPLNHALADLVEAAGDTDEAAIVLRAMVRDDYGRGELLYWPRVAWAVEMSGETTEPECEE